MATAHADQHRLASGVALANYEKVGLGKEILHMCLETAFLHAGLVGDVLDGTEWVVVD